MRTLLTLISLLFVPVATAQDIEKPLVFIEASREGGPGHQKLPNSIPEIVQKVRESGREQEVDLEVTLLKEKADLILLFDREATFWEQTYTWMLLDGEKGTPISQGKTQWFRNTVKDAVIGVGAYWNSRLLREQNREFAVESAEPATLYVFRKGNEGNSSKEPPVRCNGRTIALMDNGRYIRASLPPGQYVFTSDDDDKPSVKLMLEEGAKYYLEMKASMWNGVGHLREADEEEAKKAMLKLKPLGQKFVVDSEAILSRQSE